MTTQSVQVKLELGHKASLRKKLTSEGFTHDWVVFVRGPEGSNIQHFVEKVVFHLHESFPKPKRVVKEPPYSVAESGYGSFNLPIEIYFKTKEEPRKIRFDYDLFLHLNGSPPVNHLRCEKLTFQNPTEDFRRKLIKAGGVGILGPNEFPGVPPSTQATTTPGTPQTSESKAFVELFGSSAHSESTEAKSSDSKDNDQSHVKKKKSSHSKDRDKDREKHKSKSLSATSSSVTNSPLMLSSPQSTPKTTSSPLTSAEKSSKHKHSSKHEGSSDHSGHKKKKKDKDRERSKDHERTKSKEKHRDKVREKEGDKQNEEHNKEKHGTVLQEKEKRKDKGGKTITCAKVELSSKKESEDKEKIKEKERSKHKDGTPVTSSSSSSSKSKGHKRSHRSKEREKAKEPSRSEKDNTSSSFESPSSKRPKPINSPAPITTSQLPLNSDIFSASDYDPFEDDVDADNTSQPPPLQPGPSDPDRSEKPMKSSLLDEMSSDVDMDISDNDDVDPEYPEPLFAESGHSPAKSDIHHSPPQIEPVISNGFSPHENVAPVRPQLSPEKKQLDAISAYKSPSASRRMNERSSAQKEHSVSKWKDSEDERSRRNPTPSPKGSSMVDDVIRRRDEDHVLEGSPLWASSQNTILTAKSSNMSPPRLSMDPPDLLKTTQHGDLLQFEAAQQRVPFLKRENHVEKMSPPNNNQPVKEPSCNELPEPVMKPGYAPNGETFELLLSLQAKLNKTKDEEILSDVVRILEESGEVFAITDASLDFDLCYLNSKTVHKLKHCLHLS